MPNPNTNECEDTICNDDKSNDKPIMMPYDEPNFRYQILTNINEWYVHWIDFFNVIDLSIEIFRRICI